jgi:AcrR family transcriptional regulator
MNDHSIFLGRSPEGLPKKQRKAVASAGKAKAGISRGKPRVRNQKRIDARSFQIGSAALDLFESKGYHTTTISDIARHAGISVGTIYQYAPDKEGVLKMVLFDILDAYAREIPKALEGLDDPLLAMRAAIRSYCEVVAVRHRAGLLGYQEGKSLKLAHRRQWMQREHETNLLIAGCIGKCIEQGDFRPLNVELMTYRIIMIAHTWALKAWHLQKVTDLETYVEDNIEFVFSGALTRAGKRHYRKLGFSLPAA